MGEVLTVLEGSKQDGIRRTILKIGEMTVKVLVNEPSERAKKNFNRRMNELGVSY